MVRRLIPAPISPIQAVAQTGTLVRVGINACVGIDYTNISGDQQTDRVGIDEPVIC